MNNVANRRKISVLSYTSETSNRQVTFRLTLSEFRLLKELAGDSTISDLVRDSLRCLLHDKPLVKQERKILNPVQEEV